MTKKLPVVIDMNTIHDLRMRGLRDEANKMIALHQKIIRENMADGKRRNHVIIDKIRRHKLQVKGICVMCGKNPRMKSIDTQLCEVCRNRKANYMKKYKEGKE